MGTGAEQEPPRDDVTSIGSLGDPTRRALYEFVTRQAEPCGRDEAAAAAGVGRTLAAYHLDRMVEDGLLEVSFARRTGRSGPGAGRPAKLYRRAAREFNIHLPPRDYELAARIFADALDSEPTGRAKGALQESAESFGCEVAAEVERRAAGRSEARRLAVLEEVLAERGYEPFHDDDGVIRLRNCPFDRLADAHRQMVCGMNLALLEQAAASPKGTIKAVLDPRPGLCCVALMRTEETRKRRRLGRN
ncbi:MAG TPA: transcriptional regulator [Acidimicrobiia bacterium]|nr:transcriptional regulator [Acidimicrobiia bacterium]